MAAKLPLDIHEAFYRVVHDYPAGVPALAAKMGISPKVLYNKADPGNDSNYKPTAADCVLVTIITGDKRVVQAFNRTVGGVFVELPDLSNLSTDALMLHLLRIQEESGHFHGKLNAALEKDGISLDEYADIEREAHEFVAAILESLVRIKEMSGGVQ